METKKNEILTLNGSILARDCGREPMLNLFVLLAVID